MTMKKEIEAGDVVRLVLHGDNTVYIGIMSRPRKMEVYIPEYNKINKTDYLPWFMADENNIEWCEHY